MIKNKYFLSLVIIGSFAEKTIICIDGSQRIGAKYLHIQKQFNNACQIQRASYPALKDNEIYITNRNIQKLLYKFNAYRNIYFQATETTWSEEIPQLQLPDVHCHTTLNNGNNLSRYFGCVQAYRLKPAKLCNMLFQFINKDPLSLKDILDINDLNKINTPDFLIPTESSKEYATNISNEFKDRLAAFLKGTIPTRSSISKNPTIEAINNRIKVLQKKNVKLSDLLGLYELAGAVYIQKTYFGPWHCDDPLCHDIKTINNYSLNETINHDDKPKIITYNNKIYNRLSNEIIKKLERRLEKLEEKLDDRAEKTKTWTRKHDFDQVSPLPRWFGLRESRFEYLMDEFLDYQTEFQEAEDLLLICHFFGLKSNYYFSYKTLLERLITAYQSIINRLQELQKMEDVHHQNQTLVKEVGSTYSSFNSVANGELIRLLKINQEYIQNAKELVDPSTKPTAPNKENKDTEEDPMQPVPKL